MPVFTASVIVSVAAAVIATVSAIGKLTRHEQVVASIHEVVGVPLERLPLLAALELAGAVGLIIGIWVPPIGIAAAAGLVAYFVGAMIAHLRVGDTKGMFGPVVPLLVSIAALVLRILST
jgi:hypothetical protein